MTEHVLRPVEEVERVFEQLNTLFDLQIKRLENTTALSVIERKKLEMSDDLDFDIPDSAKLAREAPEWYDGYHYGLLRGYWRALLWLTEPNDIDLLEEKD